MLYYKELFTFSSVFSFSFSIEPWCPSELLTNFFLIVDDKILYMHLRISPHPGPSLVEEIAKYQILREGMIMQPTQFTEGTCSDE